MPDNSQLFDRLLSLSHFDGDSRGALLSLYEHFSSDYADCSLALLLVRDQSSGSCRLAGLIGPDGTEHVPNTDPNGTQVELAQFDDVFAHELLHVPCAHVMRPTAAVRKLPLAQALFGPASALAVPLANAGEISHWLVWGSADEASFQYLIANQIALDGALLHANLAASLIVRPIALRALTKETQRQRNEIESLADIQKLLLPDNPQIKGLEYAIHWQPAKTAAGDYYEMTNLTALAPPDFAPNGMDVFGVIIADVSGHGVGAAAEAVQFDAILRTYRGDGNSPPAGAISYANKYFFSRRNRGHFMTLFALVYRPDTRVMHYLSAGHPPALQLRDGTVTLLGEGDQIPLGILRDYEYHNNVYIAQKNDLFVLYTDGIVEARNAVGEEFGMRRLCEHARIHAAGSAQQLCSSLITAVEAHQGESIGTDDQTLLVLRVTH